MRSWIAEGYKPTHRHCSCTERVRYFVPASVTVFEVAAPRMSFLTKPRMHTSNRLYSAGLITKVFRPLLGVLRIKVLNTMMRARLEVPDLCQNPPRRDHASFAALIRKVISCACLSSWWSQLPKNWMLVATRPVKPPPCKCAACPLTRPRMLTVCSCLPVPCSVQSLWRESERTMSSARTRCFRSCPSLNSLPLPTSCAKEVMGRCKVSSDTGSRTRKSGEFTSWSQEFAAGWYTSWIMSTAPVVPWRASQPGLTPSSPSAHSANAFLTSLLETAKLRPATRAFWAMTLWWVISSRLDRPCWHPDAYGQAERPRMPLQQSTDETVAHFFYNVDHPDCLTTLLAVLLVQGTSLCWHPVNRHGVMATNQSEQRAHTLSKKSADHGMSQFVYPNPQPFVSIPRVGQNRVLQNSRRKPLKTVPLFWREKISLVVPFQHNPDNRGTKPSATKCVEKRQKIVYCLLNSCIPGSLSISTCEYIQHFTCSPKCWEISPKDKQCWQELCGGTRTTDPPESHKIHWRMNHSLAGLKHTLERSSCVLWSFRRFACYLQGKLSCTTRIAASWFQYSSAVRGGSDKLEPDTRPPTLFEHPQENEHGPAPKNETSQFLLAPRRHRRKFDEREAQCPVPFQEANGRDSLEPPWVAV